MNLLEEFKKNPGFVYRIGTDYYYIGKWICKPCTDEAVTDCHAMYEMCIQAKEQANAALYFQKLRAYSEFPWTFHTIRQRSFSTRPLLSKHFPMLISSLLPTSFGIFTIKHLNHIQKCRIHIPA